MIDRARTATARWRFDKSRVAGMDWLVGVDEVGRGCLAGPVVAAAIAARPAYFSKNPWNDLAPSIADSKTVRAEIRMRIVEQLRQTDWRGDLIFATAEATVREIETHNIVGATCLAMDRALSALVALGMPRPVYAPDELFAPPDSRVRIQVDGRPMARLPWPHESIIRGDSKSHLIALASILAKETRDTAITALGKDFPHYAWADNKGYGTKKHLEAIRLHGPCHHHRQSFL